MEHAGPSWTLREKPTYACEFCGTGILVEKLLVCSGCEALMCDGCAQESLQSPFEYLCEECLDNLDGRTS